VRLGGLSQEGQLLQGTVQPPARQARREEGDLRRGRFDAYRNLPHGTEHEDLGADHFDRRSTEIKVRRLAAQIQKLGFEVEIRPLSQAA
jgi:hypothetical protein